MLCGFREALQVLIHSARVDSQVSAEAPPDGPDTRGLLRFDYAASVSLFFNKLFISGPWSWNDSIMVLKGCKIVEFLAFSSITHV